MASEIEARLAALGIELPTPGKPGANYVPFVITGNLVFISGQVPLAPDGVKFVGKLGQEYGIEEGQQAARLCAVNILGMLKAAVGDLDRISRVVKVLGFVNAVPDFTDVHKVINGASDLITEVFGDDVGKHARSAIGMGTLPLGVAVEVEAIAEIR
ncbi:RidA family protein [Bauldia litoralis]|uniref:RidA family protein n=2 Tax=Bauldia litoralis TaxID=665467 RepID=UPI003267B6E6